MSDNLGESQIIVTGKNTFEVSTTEINEIQTQEENRKETQIQTQQSDKNYFNIAQGDSVEIVESFQSEILIDPAEAVEKLNSETRTNISQKRNKTDKTVERRTMKSWRFPALFGTSKKSLLNSKPNGDEEAPAIQTNIFEPRTHAVGWFKLSRPGLREDADDNEYDEIASYGSFVNERPAGPMYNPEIHNYYIYYVFKLVLKMLCVTDVAFLIVNNFINYPKWALKYFKVDWPRKHFKKYGNIYMDVAIGVYVFVTYAFYCGPCTKHPKNGKIFMFLGMVSVTIIAMSYYVLYNFTDIIFSFYSATVVAAGCLILAKRLYNFTNPLLYLICIVATLFPLLILYYISTRYLKRIKYRDDKSRIKLVLLCLYQSLAMIVQVAMVTGHRATNYMAYEVYFAAFQIYSAFWQVFITIIEIMGLIEIECE